MCCDIFCCKIKKLTNFSCASKHLKVCFPLAAWHSSLKETKMQLKLKISTQLANIHINNLMFIFSKSLFVKISLKCFGFTWHNFLAYFQMGKNHSLILSIWHENFSRYIKFGGIFLNIAKFFCVKKVLTIISFQNVTIKKSFILQAQIQNVIKVVF
jgi:hypothetical protein